MALSYDAAFLAILLDSLEDAPDAPAQEHCVVHPIKKKTLIYNRAVDYAGDVMLLLAWYKLLDDAKDENRFYAKATMVILRGIYRDLRIQYPDLCKGIEENLANLATLERHTAAVSIRRPTPFPDNGNHFSGRCADAVWGRCRDGTDREQTIGEEHA